MTPVENRVFWTDPGAHSAIKLWGKPYALVTDEVYGKLGGVLPAHGCPWGWVRIIDIRDETRPRVAAEYRLPVERARDLRVARRPTATTSASFSRPQPDADAQPRASSPGTARASRRSRSPIRRQPRSAAQFVPEPLPVVQTEDPALSQGRDKVVMWSFPDHQGRARSTPWTSATGSTSCATGARSSGRSPRTGFLDGNSNSGDALRLE